MSRDIRILVSPVAAEADRLRAAHGSPSDPSLHVTRLRTRASSRLMLGLGGCMPQLLDTSRLTVLPP